MCAGWSPALKATARREGKVQVVLDAEGAAEGAAEDAGERGGPGEASEEEGTKRGRRLRGGGLIRT